VCVYGYMLMKNQRYSYCKKYNYCTYCNSQNKIMLFQSIVYLYQELKANDM